MKSELGNKYMAMVIGYDLPRYVILQLDSKYSAYLDVSNYKCEKELIEEAFPVSKFVEVVVRHVEHQDLLICDQTHPIKISDKPKEEKDEGLTFNLKSLLDNIDVG